MAGVSLWGLLACTGPADGTGDTDPTRTSDSGSAPGTEVLFLAETGAGRYAWLHAEDGAVLGEQCLGELFPDACDEGGCHAFGGWGSAGEPVVAYVRPEVGRGGSVGGVATLTPGRPPSVVDLAESLDWETHAPAGGPDCTGDPLPAACRLRQPHQVLVDADGRWVVADTGNDRVLWLEPDGAVVAVLDSGHPDWGGCGWPNGLAWAPEGLLLTCKGTRGDAGASDHGQIALWDVADPTAPLRHWRWPADGVLAAPHGAHVSGERLIWAHSRGAGGLTGHPQLGSVGLARWLGTAPPVYLADGVGEDLGFLRSVAVGAGGTLWVNDTGCQRRDEDCQQPARVLALADVALEPTGESGHYSEDHVDQRFVVLETLGPPLLEDLAETFQVLPWAGEVPVAGACP